MAVFETRLFFVGAPGGAHFLTVESFRQGTGEKVDEKRGEEYQDNAWAGGYSHFAMPYFYTNDYSTSPHLDKKNTITPIAIIRYGCFTITLHRYLFSSSVNM